MSGTFLFSHIASGTTFEHFPTLLGAEIVGFALVFVGKLKLAFRFFHSADRVADFFLLLSFGVGHVLGFDVGKNSNLLFGFSGVIGEDRDGPGNGSKGVLVKIRVEGDG